MQRSSQNVNPGSQVKKKCHSTKNAVKEEYETLTAKMEAKTTGLENGDKCLAWLLQHIKRTKSTSCYCKGFEDEILGLKECRQIFRKEVLHLKDELDLIHSKCEDQIVLEKQEVARNTKKCNRVLEKAKAEREEKKKAFLQEKITKEELEAEKEYQLRKQAILDREGEIVQKEESLANRRRQLEEYEKEIEDTEIILNKRQTMCDRKHEDLITMHEELRELQNELDLSQNESSERAQRNWEIIRRNLQDRQKLLESNVQKYRTELASASATITGKDIQINKMHEQITELASLIDTKDGKIRQLESRLAMALAETMKTEKADFSHWRLQKRGVGYTDSFIEDGSNFSSTDNSLDNSPSRFNSRPSSQLYKFQTNSLNANSYKLVNGSSTMKDFSEDGIPEGPKFSGSIVNRNHFVNDKGDITPAKERKSNSSSACIIM